MTVKLNDLPPEALAKIAHMIRKPDRTEGIDPDADLPVPTGYHVLCLQYVRSEEHVGRNGTVIILPGQTLREDAYQGRIGLVLALGEDAYKDDAKFPSGAWVKVGDFVAWPSLENAAARYAFDSGTLACIPDDRLTMRACPPERMMGR